MNALYEAIYQDDQYPLGAANAPYPVHRLHLSKLPAFPTD
jgi:hypothetical protein